MNYCAGMGPPAGEPAAGHPGRRRPHVLAAPARARRLRRLQHADRPHQQAQPRRAPRASGRGRAPRRRARIPPHGVGRLTQCTRDPGARSSRRCSRTSASPSRSSPRRRSPARRRCSPSRSTPSPTPATRGCCSSAVAGPGGRADDAHPFGYGARAVLLGVRRRARPLHPRRALLALRGHREAHEPAPDREPGGRVRRARHRRGARVAVAAHRGARGPAPPSATLELGPVHPPDEESRAVGRAARGHRRARRPRSRGRRARSRGRHRRDALRRDRLDRRSGCCSRAIAVVLAVEMKSC